jgi:hypothetical protein
MKRSTMIMLLTQEYGNEQVATDLLNVAERNGMKPPPVEAIIIRGKNYRWGAMCSMRCTCDECTPSTLMYEWEKEDEI